MTNHCLSYVVLLCCAAMVPELERFANVDLTVGGGGVHVPHCVAAVCMRDMEFEVRYIVAAKRV